MRVKSKKSLRGQGAPPEAPADPKKAAGDAPATPSSTVSVYFVAAFTLHQFDVSSLSREQAPEEWDSLTDTEVLALPDVQEMYASFAGLFPPKDCARALKYNAEDFEEAANWLIESKQKPSSVWQVSRTKSTLFCESVLASKWTEGPGNKNHESEVHCAKNSVLGPACIAAGRWTMTTGQLTYHQVDQQRGETGVAYVFSRDQGRHLQPMHGQGDPKAADKTHAETFASHSPDPQYLWDGAKWQGYTRQQVAEQVHVAAKRSIMEEAAKAGSEPPKPFEFVTEWELFEPIKVKSTLVKVYEDKQSLLLSAQAYLTYDPRRKKFLAMPLTDQAFRNVVVYDDPSNLLPRSREAPSADVDATSFKSFVAEAFGVLAWAN